MGAEMKIGYKTFYAVTGGQDFGALLARANTNKRKDALAEAKKYKCAEVWRITETGPKTREKILVKIIGSPKEVAW